MKKLLLASLIILSIYSCKKSSTSANTSSTTWISGKWQREAYIDTVFNGKSVAGINSFPVDLNPNELNFSGTTTGSTSVFNAGSFNYSLKALTVTYSSGVSWKIVQLSSIRFKLIMHSNSSNEGWSDQYVKE
ncbi:MAG: hypothetical protein ACHQHN_08175 [Sphingobacteriales bacterium]